MAQSEEEEELPPHVRNFKYDNSIPPHVNRQRQRLQHQRHVRNFKCDNSIPPHLNPKQQGQHQPHVEEQKLPPHVIRKRQRHFEQSDYVHPLLSGDKTSDVLMLTKALKQEQCENARLEKQLTILQNKIQILESQLLEAKVHESKSTCIDWLKATVVNYAKK